MKVAAQAILPVPAEEVWRRLAAWEDQAGWMRDADSVRVLTRQREGVGVRIAVRTRVLGRLMRAALANLRSLLVAGR